MPYIETDNTRLFYLEHGIGEIPVIFGHGTLISSNIWRDFYFPGIPEEWRVFAPDFRGHGASKEAQSGCNFVRMADDIAEIIACNRLGKVFYAGLSMGGGVGLQLALNYPSLLKGLVLISSVTGLGPLGNPAFTKLGPYMCGKRWLLKMAMRMAASRKPSSSELNAVVEEALQVSPETLREYLSTTNVITGTDRINTLDIPVLMILGMKDRVIPAQQQLTLGKKIPNCQIEIDKNGGHALCAEQPEWVLKCIIDFVNKHR